MNANQQGDPKRGPQNQDHEKKQQQKGGTMPGQHQQGEKKPGQQGDMGKDRPTENPAKQPK